MSRNTTKAAKDIASSVTVKRRNCTRSISHSVTPTAMGIRKWPK